MNVRTDRFGASNQPDGAAGTWPTTTAVRTTGTGNRNNSAASAIASASDTPGAPARNSSTVNTAQSRRASQAANRSSSSCTASLTASSATSTPVTLAWALTRLASWRRSDNR